MKRAGRPGRKKQTSKHKVFFEVRYRLTVTLLQMEYVEVARDTSWKMLPGGDWEHVNTGEILTTEELVEYLKEDYKLWLQNLKGNYLREYR